MKYHSGDKENEVIRKITKEEEKEEKKEGKKEEWKEGAGECLG